MPIQTEKLIILDRDGVINLESRNYIKSPEEWIPIPSSLKAIAKLNHAGYKVAIATNQSGIARNYFSEITLVMIHKKMEAALAQVGGHIDALEYCPDHPNSAGPMRKPSPGMLNKLIKTFNVNPNNTWFVGDSKSDIECAVNAGCQPVLVLTGDGKETLENNKIAPNITVFSDLSEFVNDLIKQPN